MEKNKLLIGLLILMLVMPGCGYLTPQGTAAILPVVSPDQTPAATMETATPQETTPAPDETESAPVLGVQQGKIKIQSYTNVPQKAALLQDTGKATVYVGLGYNVLESTYIEPQGFTLGRPILKADEVQKRLKRGDAPSQSSYTISGETVKKYTEDLSAKLKLKSKHPLFSGSFESEFDKSQTKKSDVYFIKSISGYPKYSEYIDITDDFMDILDPTFEKNLNGSMSPEELFDAYGTHLVVEALMGARCTYNYTYTATSAQTTTQIKAKVDATYRFISGSASAEDTKTAEEFLSSTSFQSVLSGGKDVDATTLANLLKNFQSWVDSLATATPTIYGISNMNSLIPVWTLTADKARAKELEDFYNERGGDIRKLIDAMSVIPAPAPAPETYIKSIVITSDEDYDTSIDGSSYPGYKRIGRDLNKDVGGDFIYMWYNTTNDPAQALTDIRITYGDFKLSGPYTKNPHDLNKNAGGEYIYLWTSTSSTVGAPIKSINVIFGENADMPSGYSVVKYNDSKAAAELNKGAGGAFIYMGIKR